MRRLIAGLAALALAAAAAVTLGTSSSSADALTFSATFDQPGDFAAQFDYGYSGPNPWDWGNGSGAGAITSFSGDHDPACDGPTTARTVAFGGTRTNLNYSQLFWQCGPPSPTANGHLMTAVDTISYNIAWFSPKPTFTAVTKVCWDINETELSHRKWTQVLFVGAADAVKYPNGGPTSSSATTQARGTGGFDLGYVAPDFSNTNGPTTGIVSTNGTLVGVKVAENAPQWFQGGNFTTQFTGPGNVLDGITDKAARYTQCVANQTASTVLFTQNTPTGARSFTLQGQIPQDARRVVFEDDNYDPQHGDPAYSPSNLTWHWDNVQVFTAGGAPPSTTTTAATTTIPPTTTTLPPTTTTTTIAPTTTTTVPDPCAAFTDPGQHAWCTSVEARLHALGG